MVKIQGSTVIARPVEEVFDFVADERNERKYNPHLVWVEKVTPGPISEGTRWAAMVESRGRQLDMDLEVTEYARPSRLGSTTSMPTAEISGAVTFLPDADGTRLGWSWDLQPLGWARLIGPVLARLGRRQEERLWADLKRYLEDVPHRREDR